MTIDWDKPIEMVEVSSGVVVPTAEPTEYIGVAVGRIVFTSAVRAWGKVYLVSATGEIQNIPEFRVRNVREPRYRPYTPDELAALVGTAVRNNNTGHTVLIACHKHGNNYVHTAAGEMLGDVFMLAHYTHLDGTPCGVLVEDDE